MQSKILIAIFSILIAGCGVFDSVFVPQGGISSAGNKHDDSETVDAASNPAYDSAPSETQTGQSSTEVADHRSGDPVDAWQGACLPMEDEAFVLETEQQATHQRRHFTKKVDWVWQIAYFSDSECEMLVYTIEETATLLQEVFLDHESQSSQIDHRVIGFDLINHEANIVVCGVELHPQERLSVAGWGCLHEQIPLLGSLRKDILFYDHENLYFGISAGYDDQQRPKFLQASPLMPDR